MRMVERMGRVRLFVPADYELVVTVTCWRQDIMQQMSWTSGYLVAEFLVSLAAYRLDCWA